jgi:hypothetical protein
VEFKLIASVRNRGGLRESPFPAVIFPLDLTGKIALRQPVARMGASRRGDIAIA